MAKESELITTPRQSSSIYAPLASCKGIYRSHMTRTCCCDGAMSFAYGHRVGIRTRDALPGICEAQQSNRILRWTRSLQCSMTLNFTLPLYPFVGELDSANMVAVIPCDSSPTCLRPSLRSLPRGNLELADDSHGVACALLKRELMGNKSLPSLHALSTTREGLATDRPTPQARKLRVLPGSDNVCGK